MKEAKEEVRKWVALRTFGAGFEYGHWLVVKEGPKEITVKGGEGIYATARRVPVEQVFDTPAELANYWRESVSNTVESQRKETATLVAKFNTLAEFGGVEGIK